MENIKCSIPASRVKAYAMDADTTMTTLSNLGVNATDSAMREFMRYAQDALPNTITTPSNATPVQFLQHWLPDVIKVVTKARVADRLLGRDIAGSWSQEEIVATVVEHIGQMRRRISLESCSGHCIFTMSEFGLTVTMFCRLKMMRVTSGPASSFTSS